MIFRELFFYFSAKLTTVSPFLLQSNRYGRYNNGDEDEGSGVIAIIIAAIMIIGVLVLFSSIVRDFVVYFILNVPAFTKNFKFNRHNLRFAYKVIGCHVVVADVGDRRDQYIYLISYLKRRFPALEAMNLRAFPNMHELYPDTEIVFSWLNDHLDEEHKLQVVDFMADLAFHNEKLSKREMTMIYRAGKIFGIPQSEVKSILSIRYKFYQDKRQREKEHRSNQRTTRKSSSYLKKQALAILGLDPSASDFSLVKKAYRQLVKKHHPDRFSNDSKGEQQKAHERFIEINTAYEYLETAMN